jgi:hypothetical protein
MRPRPAVAAIIGALVGASAPMNHRGFRFTLERSAPSSLTTLGWPSVTALPVAVADSVGVYRVPAGFEASSLTHSQPTGGAR